jgi:hypothetical protein
MHFPGGFAMMLPTHLIGLEGTLQVFEHHNRVIARCVRNAAGQ